MPNSSCAVRLLCTECGKEHNRIWRAHEGYGTCNVCGSSLSLGKKRYDQQNEKAKKELKELGW